MSDNFVERFVHSLRDVPETDARLARIPPSLVVATGHDDDVMLFVIRVGDPAATLKTLLSLFTLAESAFILDEVARTKGLIHKRIPIDAAQWARETLRDAGTEVEFLQPMDD
ncbi:MAG: hypothetical protein ACYC0X_26535 [Pirellulaceae bacterium]